MEKGEFMAMVRYQGEFYTCPYLMEKGESMALVRYQCKTDWNDH